MKRRKFIILGVIIFVAVGYLAYQGFAGAATYYYTVSEVLEKGSSVYGEKVRVNGEVTPGSLQEAGGSKVKFTIKDDNKTLPVLVSKGAIPDTFTTADEVVVEGSMDSTGTFQAISILTKCPSKYVPASN